MSASVSCVVFAIFRRSLPTRRVSRTKNGISANAKSASSQFRSEHADHRRDHRRDVRGDRRRRVRDDALHAADVVRDPRLHLAGAGAREEGEREALEVPEDGGAQVVHDALPDLVREERLQHPEHAADDRDRDHPARGVRDGRLVVALDRDHDPAQQERRQDAERRGDDDQRQQPPKDAASTAGRAGDPAQVRAPDGRVVRALGRLAATSGSTCPSDLRVRRWA